MAAAAAALLLGTAARALPISGLVVTNNSNLVYGSGPPTGASGDQFAQHGLQVLTNNPSDFSTRFWTTGAADRPVILLGNQGTASATSNMSYTITFSVTVTNGWLYTLDVLSSLQGAVTAVDDQALIGSGGNATVGSINGSLSGGSVASGSLSLPGSSASGTTSTNSNVPVFRSDTAQIVAFGTGAAQAYSLTFTGSFNATSPRSASGGDEHAYRFGIGSASGSTLNGASADDYGGIGSRNGLQDGHFVSVSLTVVPEPGTALLVTAGLAGLARLARRRARAERSCARRAHRPRRGGPGVRHGGA
jgi:hypothetical protein